MSVEELGDYGVERMGDQEIGAFLSSQGTGVLGLPTAAAPYLLPLSFGYDGESALYLTYVLGAESRKAELSDRAEQARFLVYKADSPFNWESVVLTGRIGAVPREEWATAAEALENAWSPDIFEQAELTGGIRIYRFDIDERTGIKHLGLPPKFRTEA